MEANKTVNEELRSQKSTNMLIGYVLALAAMFVAFEYTQMYWHSLLCSSPSSTLSAR